MRESIGGSLLLYIVLFFIGLIILFFAAILSYAKAYRVKNRIINYVENGEYKDDGELIKGIDKELQDIGYSYNKNSNCNFNNAECDSNKDLNVKSNFGDNYNYCLCKVTLGTDDGSGYYYEVITFTEFEFPIIKNVIRSNVHGESKIMGKTYIDYEY